MKKLLIAILAAVAILVLIVVLRAARLGAVESPAEQRIALAVDDDSAAMHLGQAVQFPTISVQEGAIDSAAFLAFQEWMERTYPLVHSTLARERIGGLSLFFTWRGTDSTRPPVVLMGHQDVVPVIPGTEAKWTHPPFSGAVAGGYVWGRGTLDDKGTVVAVLEAVERLLRDGHRPTRTIFLAFGHDEEVGGLQGAQLMAGRYRGMKLPAPVLVLDEGGAVFDGAPLGLSGPVAMVGVAEKGFTSLELVIEGEGGHSSTPPRATQIGRLARAVKALEDEQFPASLDGATRALMETIAPVLPMRRRLVVGNLWLFSPLMERALLAQPQTAAMLRTTTAPTIFQAGAKDNVLPPFARAVVNFRIRPGETVNSVIARVQRVIDDSAVKVRPIGFRSDPSPVSPHDSPAFRVVASTIRQTLAATAPIVAPYLVLGGTDARYWSPIAPSVYRFNPFPFEPDALTRAHGTNERISVKGFADGVRYYVQLVRNLEQL